MSNTRAEDLLHLLELARTGRVVDAARRLGVRHTTVARRISALERSIGRRLVDRTSRGWLLTDDGEELMKYAETIETTLHAIDEFDGRSTARGIGGTIRIAAQDGIGATVIADAIIALRHVHPHLEIELTTATRRFDISARDYDIAITLQKPPTNQFVVGRLTDYQLGLYATNEYLENHPSVQRREDLAEHSIAWYIESLLDLPELESLETSFFPRRPALRSSNIFAQLRFVKGHGCIGLLPQYLIVDDSAPLVHVLPEEVSIIRTFWIVTRRDAHNSGRVKTVVDHLVRHVADARGQFL